MSVYESIAKAFEEACMSISVGFGEDETNATIGDAIAHWRHETDLSGARELIYDQSGDAAEALLAAISEAGFVIVPREVTLDMQRAYFGVIDKNMERVETDPTFGRHSSNTEAYRAMIKAAPEHGPKQVTHGDGT